MWKISDAHNSTKFVQSSRMRRIFVIFSAYVVHFDSKKLNVWQNFTQNERVIIVDALCNVSDIHSCQFLIFFDFKSTLFRFDRQKHFIAHRSSFIVSMNCNKLKTYMFQIDSQSTCDLLVEKIFFNLSIEILFHISHQLITNECCRFIRKSIINRNSKWTIMIATKWKQSSNSIYRLSYRDIYNVRDRAKMINRCIFFT